MNQSQQNRGNVKHSARLFLKAKKRLQAAARLFDQVERVANEAGEQGDPVGEKLSKDAGLCERLLEVLIDKTTDDIVAWPEWLAKKAMQS